MGSALSTSGLVAFATALLIIMAILILVADDRVKSITGYSANYNLTAAHSKLVWAQVLAWIAAGLGLLLVIGYVALHFLETSEWLHLILWILLFAALVASGIFLAIALNDINRGNVNDDKGSTGYIWGALISGGAALLILLISGGWRVAHNSWENDPEEQYYMDANSDVPLVSLGKAPRPQETQLQVTTTPNEVSGTVAAPT